MREAGDQVEQVLQDTVGASINYRKSGTGPVEPHNQRMEACYIG